MATSGPHISFSDLPSCQLSDPFSLLASSALQSGDGKHLAWGQLSFLGPWEMFLSDYALFPIEHRGDFGILLCVGLYRLELTPEMEAIYCSYSNDLTIFVQPIWLDPVVDFRSS